MLFRVQGLLGAIALHAGRDMVLFGAMQAVDAPEVRQSPFLLVIFIGWSTTEIVRYAFYALNVQQVCPYVVKWMRYTFPLLVFPFVSYTEVYVEYLALPFVRERRLMSSPPMPNALNFEVHGSAILMVAMAAHALATPMLFAYLLQNRIKALGPSKEDKAAAAAAAAATTKSKRA